MFNNAIRHAPKALAQLQVLNVMRFVEGCDFREFSTYLVEIGQSAAGGELDGLSSSARAPHFAEKL